MKRSMRWRAVGGAIVAMTLTVSMLPLVALAGGGGGNPPSDNPCPAEFTKIDPPDDETFDWGSADVHKDSGYVEFTVNDGWEVEVCVKGGPNYSTETIEGPDTEDVYTPTWNSRHPDVSHYGYKVVTRPGPQYITAVWEMPPGEPDGQGATYPQTYVGHIKGADIAAATAQYVPEGNCVGYQIDIYKIDPDGTIPSGLQSLFDNGLPNAGADSQWLSPDHSPRWDVIEATENCEPEEIADPTWEVTPESLVCNPDTGEYEAQADGSITFDPFDHGSWDASNLTGLSAGTYGPFLANADDGYVFASTQTETFSTGEVEVEAEGHQEPCDQQVRVADPEIVQSQECEVEGTLTVPDIEGAQYLLDGEAIEAGEHTGPISGTLTAEAEEGYVLTNPDFSVEVDIPAAEDCPYVVTPVTPSLVEASECGVPDRLVVPETGGVIYLLDGVDVSGQTLEGPLSGTMVAEAAPDHELSEELVYEFTLDAAEECEDSEAEDETTATTTTPDDDEIDPEVEEETTSSTIPEEDDEEETDDETQDTLPFTGMGTGGAAAAAAAALAAGSALVGLSRRREDGSAS